MSTRIVFMGTPEFALASLSALHQASDIDVAAVVTVADKPAGRGRQLQESAVKRYAVEQQLPVLQPERLRDPNFLEDLERYNADLFVVVAFRMLPELVWSMPRLGTINLHGSLLPQYRGAAPIHHALINGELQTGCTTFLISHEIDTGAILLQKTMDIGPNETTGEVHDRMKEIGAMLLVETVRGLAEHNIQGLSQDEIAHEVLKEAPKLDKAFCRVNWKQPQSKVHNHIRGLSPFPGAWTELDGKAVKLYLGQQSDRQSNLPPGCIETTLAELYVSCGDGFMYQILELQPPGKRRMSADAFLKGNKLDQACFV